MEMTEVLINGKRKGGRGRKKDTKGSEKKPKVYGVEKKIQTKSVENVILYLPIKTEDLKKMSNTIMPYDNDSMVFEELKDKELKSKLETKEKEEPGIIVKDSLLKPEGYIQKRLMTLQIEFLEGNRRRELPYSTTTACHWCCHSFDDSPVGIPDRYMDGKFYVRGIYCSFNCAASAIFDKNTIDQWERYSLLNLLYQKTIGSDKLVKISLAPPKESLKLFGGPLTIDEYRECLLKNDRTFKVVQPPMISLVPKLEENILDFEMSGEQNFVPLNHQLIQQANKSIRAKRKEARASVTFSDFIKIRGSGSNNVSDGENDVKELS